MGQAVPGSTWVKVMPAVFVVIWSTGFIVARYAMPHAPPFKFLALRFFLSVACFGVWAVLSRAAWPADRRQWAHLAVTGLFMHAGYLGGVWAAVKLGMGEVHAASFSLALGALLSMTMGTLYQKRYLQPCAVPTANLVQNLAAFALMAPLALLLETEAVHFNAPLLGALAWSVLALTLGGSSLLYLLIQRGAATSVTSLLYLVPPTTAFMAWVLFSEPITVVTVAGTALTALGVSLVVRTPAAKPIAA